MTTLSHKVLRKTRHDGTPRPQDDPAVHARCDRQTMPKRPLVLACAGCSFAGQLAYNLALELDCRGLAEMSCMAGVGARKRAFLRQLQNRPVWVIDGCPIACGEGILAQVSCPAYCHIQLHHFGFAKKRPPAHGVDMDALIDEVLIYATSRAPSVSIENPHPSISIPLGGGK